MIGSSSGVSSGNVITVYLAPLASSGIGGASFFWADREPPERETGAAVTDDNAADLLRVGGV
jgi:hypothetical protein